MVNNYNSQGKEHMEGGKCFECKWGKIASSLVPRSSQ
jgi:hypothetical protein